jgi:hypothetical protein
MYILYKHMNDISDSNTSEVLHTLWRSERAVALPALAPCLKASTSGGEISRATPTTQTAFQGGLDIIYPFTFPAVSNA